jgi:uncharacterized protein YdcH (DUF465 family)
MLTKSPLIQAAKLNNLTDTIAKLEKERQNTRNPNHKALLTSLKKQRLVIESELSSNPNA